MKKPVISSKPTMPARINVFGGKFRVTIILCLATFDESQADASVSVKIQALGDLQCAVHAYPLGPLVSLL